MKHRKFSFASRLLSPKSLLKDIGGAILALAALLPISGCASLSGPAMPLTRFDVIATRAAWQPQVVETGRFDLRAFSPSPVHAASPGEPLTIYIEGDGNAYIGRRLVSADPTPINPGVLQMALADPGPAAYLARPCQFIAAQRSHCGPTDWTRGRYSQEIIDGMDRAVSILARQAEAERVILVGYSGGGTVAMLLAARRRDVAGVVTIAANLDLADWIARNRLSPMPESLDAAGSAAAVTGIPQVHFVGGRDKIVQSEVIQSFLKRIPSAPHAKLITMPGYDHVCCWARDWPALRRRAALAGISAWEP